MTVDPAALSLLSRLATRALDIEEGAAPAPVPMDGVADADLLAAIGRHRLTDLLRPYADVLGLPDRVGEALRARHASSRPLLTVQALETVRAARALTDAGIDTMVIKGQALAVLTTGRPDARGAGDVDLFVAPSRVADAHRVLTEQGWWVPDTGPVEPGTWAWRHLTRWGYALTYHGKAADADLHWRLEATPGTHPAFEVLWSRRVEADLGVGRVATLAAPDALRHLAAHREGAIWLRTLVDLRRLARHPDAFAVELPSLALGYLAVARASVGLPDGVPPDVVRRLDAVPPKLLDYAHRRQLGEARANPMGGVGSVRSLLDNLALSSSAADLGHVAVTLVLPPHAALPIQARSAWVGIPLAFWRRAVALVQRGILRRGAPCEQPPGHAA